MSGNLARSFTLGLSLALASGCSHTAAPGSASVPAPTDRAASAASSTGNGRILPKHVLLFTRSAGNYRHASIEPAAAAIQAALAPLGVTAEISSELGQFTPESLGRYGAVVLVSSSGSLLGPPDSEAVAAFAGFVRGGGGVVGIHAATAVAYAPGSTYVQILGGKFIGHPGNIRTASCYPEGTHPAVSKLPKVFSTSDEIYTYNSRRPDSQIDLRCDAFGSNEKVVLAWHHREGEGRVFSTGMGHVTELWGADGWLLKDHVVPAILWTLGL